GGAQRPDPPDPPQPLAPTPAPSLARPDEPPAFPEPSTASAPTALMGDRAEAGLEGTPEMARPVFTTELLATATGPVVPWPEPRAAVPGPVRTEAPVTSAPTFSPAGLPRPGPATVTSSPPSASRPPGLAAPPQVPGPTLPQAAEPQTAVTPTGTWPIGPCCFPAPCAWNLTGPEGSLESPEPPGPSAGPEGSLDCTYAISVYPGYGVEIKVQNISLLEGEAVTVETVGGAEPVVLANESFLLRGQVIRSPSNQVAVRYQSPAPARAGAFRFRFQAYVLSCRFPSRPAYGDVSVTSLHPGGNAYFSCAAGYQLQGPRALTCLNATRPFWSGREPLCVAACGGVIRNASLGRVVSPGFPGTYSNNLTCHWLLEAPPGQRLHLHFEKVSLAEDDDRCVGGPWAPPVYDSYEVEYLPIEGLLSAARHFFVELTTDSTQLAHPLSPAAFQPGHCYEPFVKYGNFTTSDAAYALGATVEFSCDPGYTLEQGSVVIECVDPTDPQWNETEPACRAVCSGEITDSAGVVLSPNWPEAYGKGQDCIWGLHVEQDKRVMLDIRVLHVGTGDVLTFYDGDDLTARILGQFTGARSRFKLYTSTADVTIQFQSDPGSSVSGYQQGFIIHFYGERSRLSPCLQPRVPASLACTVQFVCDKGYVLAGTALLTCYDRQAGGPKWSDRLPKCTRKASPRGGPRAAAPPAPPCSLVGARLCPAGHAMGEQPQPGVPCQHAAMADPQGDRARVWAWSHPALLPTAELYEPCHNPGIPEHGAQAPEKRLYQAGAMLRFSCTAGHVLLGEASLRCVPGHPSQWSSSPPLCKAGESVPPRLSVAKAMPAGAALEGTNVAVAVLLPVVAVALLLGGVCLYFSRLQGKPSLQLPLSGSHPYDHITVESAFDNPTYETGVSAESRLGLGPWGLGTLGWGAVEVRGQWGTRRCLGRWAEAAAVLLQLQGLGLGLGQGRDPVPSAPHSRGTCPTPCSLSSSQEMREYEVSI
uniref:Seizure related 6 homolog n=1 Tax=Crocodylus porosus TaxID=8502 RepID=A0A7M4FBB4_CROPO